MFSLRVLNACLLTAGLVCAADSDAVKQAAARGEQRFAKAPEALRPAFRKLAAQALDQRYPDLAKQFSDPSAAPVPAGGPGRTAAPRTPPSAEAAAIQKSMGQIRALATDAERGKVVIKLAADIRALPAGREKLNLASSLSNLATEGDLGKEALNGVAAALAQALHETEGAASNYVELAKLIRYEHVTPPSADPALDAAAAVLELRDQVLQETGFTLTALDGKVYNLEALRGHVVLLNFWATWCPPCRKEMPDMQRLYERFEKKGLIVLAVSDEKRETVEGFLAKQSYTFPILLDPDRKTNTAFYVEGIPKSFLFDRQGRLVAQSIDMRTESQFLEMFKSAGLE
jgi:peroxiredoxin